MLSMGEKVVNKLMTSRLVTGRYQLTVIKKKKKKRKFFLICLFIFKFGHPWFFCITNYHLRILLMAYVYLNLKYLTKTHFI
jgi:hypothetical protein